MSINRSTKTTERECPLRSHNPQDGVCVLVALANTHTHTKLSPTDASVCGYQRLCQELHRQAAYHCLFHTTSHREEDRECDGGDKMEEREKNKQLVQSETVTVWPFADAKGTLSGGSRGQALC